MYNWAEIAMVYTQDVERQVCSDFQLTFEVGDKLCTELVENI